MINDLVQYSEAFLFDSTDFAAFQSGHSIVQYKGQELDLNSIDVALLSWGNSNYKAIQQAFYALSCNFKAGKVIDLGMVKHNLVPLVELVDLLLQHHVFPIIIAPEAAAIEGQLKAYEQQAEMLSLVLVDSQIPFSVSKPNHSIINKLLTYHPQLLFHLKCIGYQSYLSDKNAIDFLEDKYFETHRLGKIQGKLEEIEPMVRDVDLAAFNLAAIRCADAPSCSYKNPNGRGLQNYALYQHERPTFFSLYSWF